MSPVPGDPSDAVIDAVSPTQEEIGHNAEHQPLRTLSREGLADEVEDFASAFGLRHKLDVLRKASQLLQSELLEEVPDITDQELVALHREISHKWQQPRLLYFTILICSLGAMEQGWAQTSMNGANLYFPEALGVGSDSTQDKVIVGLINSAIHFSVGLWGAWLSEPLNNRLGRRGVIFIGSMLCLTASLGCSLSGNWIFLLFFRSALGTGLGLNASTISVYAAECAPAMIRGGLAVSWQMWTAFGIFMGFVANVAVYDQGSNTWRLQLVAPSVPVVPLLTMIYMCPESPAWYIKLKRYDLAYQSLKRLRNVEIQAARDLYNSYTQQQVRPKSAGVSSSYLSRFTELFSVRRLRNAMIASYTVMITQQLCGINIISFYSSTIFSNAGFSTFGALVASCVFGFVNFIGAFPAVWAMDTLGRRSLLLWTLPFMGLALFATALTFRLPTGNMQFGLLALLIYLFCAIYSPGAGPVPTAYSAEVFPLSHREVGMSFAVATATSWATVLSLTFPSLLSWFGSEGTFELYSALNMLAFVLVFLFVRETKGKTLEELNGVFAIQMIVFIRSKAVKHLQWLRGHCMLGNEVSGESIIENSQYRELGQVDEGDDET